MLKKLHFDTEQACIDRIPCSDLGQHHARIEPCSKSSDRPECPFSAALPITRWLIELEESAEPRPTSHTAGHLDDWWARDAAILESVVIPFGGG